MYQRIIRPLLFNFDPERVHHFTFQVLRRLFKSNFVQRQVRQQFCVRDPHLEREVFGIRFPNPVGLAAGFDKDARLYKELSNFGFGFIEIGTLTPLPQPGNEKKRLFRLKEDKAIINRMGFNNEGVAAAVERLSGNPGVIIGGNIGKNKATSNEKAAADYVTCFQELYPWVDYFVVNVSSPNTPDLRELQDKKPLLDLLRKLQAENLKKKSPKPILLKIAPDLSDNQLLDIIQIVFDTGISGVIATNTTISRNGLENQARQEAGGLSGAPLRKLATEVISFLYRNSGGSFPIIGVGGIMSPEDAIEKLEAGASLVQLYTGFIYQGPGLVREINQEIIKRKM